MTVNGRPKDTSPPKAAFDRSEYSSDISDETIQKIKKCEADNTKMELCMRCAKETKSEIVYPLCCANEDGVQDWCQDYVYFGKQ